MPLALGRMRNRPDRQQRGGKKDVLTFNINYNCNFINTIFVNNSKKIDNVHHNAISDMMFKHNTADKRQFNKWVFDSGTSVSGN